MKQLDFHDVKGKKVKEPDQYTWRPAVYGILKENNKLLVIQPNWDDKFCLPGGSMNLGETLIQTLKREFLEETGFIVSVSEQPIFVDSQLFGNHKVSKFFQRISLYYEVRRVAKTKKKLDSETTKLQWIDFSKVSDKDFTFFQRDCIKNLKHS